ncbi:MAG: WhiB family transcriptional regulator [Acidimicrobiia bacterium]
MENKNIEPRYNLVLCDGKTDLFFSENTQDMRQAQMICSGCSYRVSCLENAIETKPFAGVWGGAIFVNGELSLDKRGRGRPRKTEHLDNARVVKAFAGNSIAQVVEISSDQKVNQRIA